MSTSVSFINIPHSVNIQNPVSVQEFLQRMLHLSLIPQSEDSYYIGTSLAKNTELEMCAYYVNTDGSRLFARIEAHAHSGSVESIFVTKT